MPVRTTSEHYSCFARWLQWCTNARCTYYLARKPGARLSAKYVFTRPFVCLNLRRLYCDLRHGTYDGERTRQAVCKGNQKLFKSEKNAIPHETMSGWFPAHRPALVDSHVGFDTSGYPACRLLTQQGSKTEMSFILPANALAIW